MIRSSHRAMAATPWIAAGALSACVVDDIGIGPDAAEPEEGVCHPLDEQACLLPFPSSAYLEEDAETQTGFRVAFPETAMPRTRSGIPVDPDPYNRRDGFSAAGPILVSFPSGVGERGLPPADDLGASLSQDAPIVLLDMDRGERAPYFAEVDANQLGSTAERSLIIRPVDRLEPGTRYAVALRDSVVTPDGDPLPVPAAFSDLRAGREPANARAGDVSRYEEILTALEEEGVSRDELVLAWDFVTASDAWLTRDLRAMRDQALAALEQEEELGYELREVDAGSPHVHRRIEGTFAAPNFLTRGEEDDSIIRRSDAGRPERTGTFSAELAAIVPSCAVDADEPLPVTIFGHGLMGSAAEHLEFHELSVFAQEHCRVLIGTDWVGLTSRQISLAGQAAGDVNRGPWIAEKLAQSVVNFIALQYLVSGPLGGDDAFEVAGREILDGDDVSYMGISLGGIMGSVLMAYDKEIERGVVGVPGGPWGMLLERSLYWNVFQGPLIGAYGDQLTYQVALSFMSMAFEPYDPITTAPRVRNDPVGDTPKKQIFMYQAMGDALVPNVATEMLARSMGLPVTSPTVEQPWGLETASGPAPSALTIFDESPAPLPPESNVPPDEDNGTHTTVNFLGAVSRQVAHFFETGEVRSECSQGGEPVACDCADGACD